MKLEEENRAYRLVPEREFPPYKFIQGKSLVHPNKKGGYRFNIPEPSVESKDLNNFLSNPDFLYSIDLFNHKYYWEAHVWFEAFWMSSAENTENKALFKALILICAAAIKNELEYYDIAEKQFIKAQKLIDTIKLNFNINTLAFDKFFENYIQTKEHQFLCFEEKFIV